MNIGEVCYMYPQGTAMTEIQNVRESLDAISKSTGGLEVKKEDDHLGQLGKILGIIKDLDALCFCGAWRTNRILLEINSIVTSEYFKKTIIEFATTSNGDKLIVIAK